MNKILYLLVFTLWVLSIPFMYIAGEEDVEDQLVESVAYNEQKIRQLLDIAIAYNVSIADQMKLNIVLAKPNEWQHPLTEKLQDFAHLNAYGLQGNETLVNQPFKANLTGIGALKDVKEQTMSEIDAALSLSLSTPLEGKNHDFIWSYYTSIKGFALLAPSVGINDFQFSKNVYEKPFWSIALPKNNPLKTTVISDLYDDAGEQGLMISISTPIYNAQIFKGVVSLDVGLHYLKDVLNSADRVLNENLFLISTEGVIAATKNDVRLGEILIDVESRFPASYKLYESSGKYYLLSKLIRDKFYVVYELSPSSLKLLVVKSTYNQVLMMSLLAMVLWLIINLFNVLARTKELAQYDGLSKLYNRRTLEQLAVDLFQLELNSGLPICTLMIDIDNFKTVNDQYGHQVGDQGIRHVADIVKSGVRDRDIVGRYGGEEFIVVLEATDIQQGMLIAEKIRKEIENSVFCDNKSVTVSVGIAEREFRANADTFPDSCRKADLALYAAKNSGRNCSVSYSPDHEKRKKRTP